MVIVKVCCGLDNEEAMHEERVEEGFQGKRQRNTVRVNE